MLFRSDNLRNRRKAVPTEVNWGLRQQSHSIVVQSKSLPTIKQRSLRMRLTLKEKKKDKEKRIEASSGTSRKFSE